MELNLTLSDDKEGVIEMIRETEGMENDLIIRKFTTEGINVNHINPYQTFNIYCFKPDMIVLDYIDCVESTRDIMMNGLVRVMS